MEEIATWVAPAATMIAAMMVAGNFSTRITGWGFVVYTIGAVAWCVQGVVTQQYNLLWANGFLLIVDVIGIYRWLFRRARLDDGAQKAVERSRGGSTHGLFPLSRLTDAKLLGVDGQPLAQIVDAMAECTGGRINYVMLSEGGTAGLGERLHPLAWERVRATDGGFECDLSAQDLAALPESDPQNWPAALSRA